MINQQIHIFCKDPSCERRLHLPEEWHSGLCTLHAIPGAAEIESEEPDWNAILEKIDEGYQPYRVMNRDA